MRGLHVVGVSDDGTMILLAASPDAPRPSHALPVDGRLKAAVNGEWRPNGRAESALSPKEIQKRLRAGDSVEVVARAAGVPIARVMPYAAPVLSERERIVEDARAATPKRDRGAVAPGPLGRTVDARLAGIAGLRADSVTWSARRRDDGAWVVTLDYAARGGARHAEWLWRPAQRDLRPLSVTAARLIAPDPAKPTTRRRTPARRKAGTGGGATPARARKASPAVAARSAARVAAATTPRPAARRGEPMVVPPRPAGSSWSDVLFGVADSPVVAEAGKRRRRSPAGRR